MNPLKKLSMTKYLVAILLVTTFSMKMDCQIIQDDIIAIHDSTSIPDNLISDNIPSDVESKVLLGLGELESSILADREFWTSIIVLIFAYFVLKLIVQKIEINNLDANSYVKLMLLVLIILSTWFLVAAGWDNSQLAPAFGILGTIVGYLLGKPNIVSAKPKQSMKE